MQGKKNTLRRENGLYYGVRYEQSDDVRYPTGCHVQMVDVRPAGQKSA
jgi:hypothetical protein